MSKIRKSKKKIKKTRSTKKYSKKKRIVDGSPIHIKFKDLEVNNFYIINMDGVYDLPFCIAKLQKKFEIDDNNASCTFMDQFNQEIKNVTKVFPLNTDIEENKLVYLTAFIIKTLFYIDCCKDSFKENFKFLLVDITESIEDLNLFLRNMYISPNDFLMMTEDDGKKIPIFDMSCLDKASFKRFMFSNIQTLVSKDKKTYQDYIITATEKIKVFDYFE